MKAIAIAITHEELDSLLDIEKRMQVCHDMLAHRPFPPAHIIMEVISLYFPEMDQKHIVQCVNHIKQFIKQQELITSLQTQNRNAN